MKHFPPVMILAGGLGTRMKELYPNLPKALIPVNDCPFLWHQFKMLRELDVKEVILCLGHLGSQVENYVGDGRQFGLSVHYSYDGESPLGTGGAIFKAARCLNQPFGVLYGDSYLEADLRQAKQAFEASGKEALMTVFKNNNRWGKSNVIFENGLVLDYSKVQQSAEMHYIDYGFLLFQPAVLNRFRDKLSGDKIKFDLADVIIGLVKTGQLAAFEVKERFYEIGSEEGLAELRNHLAAHPFDHAKT